MRLLIHQLLRVSVAYVLPLRQVFEAPGKYITRKHRVTKTEHWLGIIRCFTTVAATPVISDRMALTGVVTTSGQCRQSPEVSRGWIVYDRSMTGCKAIRRTSSVP